MSDNNPPVIRCQVKGMKEKDGLMVSIHRCTASFTNNWDVVLVNPVVKHTIGEVVNNLPPCTLRPGETSPPFDILFETGLGASHDYWYVEFDAIGGAKAGKWACKTNFYCDLRSQDAGTLVQLMVSIGDEDMYVTESSGQCYVSLHQQNAQAEEDAPAQQPAAAPAPRAR